MEQDIFSFLSSFLSPVLKTYVYSTFQGHACGARGLRPSLESLSFETGRQRQNVIQPDENVRNCKQTEIVTLGQFGESPIKLILA